MRTGCLSFIDCADDCWRSNATDDTLWSMDYRLLGGDRIPVIGLGAWPIGGGMGNIDEGLAISTIHHAIDAGITLIDTAQAYRTSEVVVGKALKGGGQTEVFSGHKGEF